MIKSLLVSFLIFFKAISTNIFINLRLQTFGLRCDELGIGFSHIKLYAKWGGLVSHIFLSMDSDLILFPFFMFSLPRFEFLF